MARPRLDQPTEKTVKRPVLARVRAMLHSLQPSDARVAQVVLDDPEAAIHNSVSEVAETAETSTATVVRCAQKLGFRGFHDLKIALAQELAAFDPRALNAGASDEPVDARVAALHHVTTAGAQTVRDAGAIVEPVTFDAAVSALADALRTLFLGVGTSAPLAQDAAYRFSAIGLQAQAPADVHVQHVHARLLGPQDACVAVSHTGATRETLTALEAARHAGATTIAITSFTRSPLTDLAQHTIVAGTREVSFGLEAMASRLAHLALLDALLVAVAARDETRSQAALALYGDVLGEHRL